MNGSGVVEYVPVVVVGGGQAGLSVSWHLGERGIGHVVLERDTLMHAWTDARWDSFCLVTPNWQCRLPGYAYAGDDPDGFMVKDELTAWLRGWLDTFSPPVRTDTAVTSVRPVEDGVGFDVRATSGDGREHLIHCDQVVVATGGYHRPRLPRMAERLPGSIRQLHSSQYRNPQQLPAGDVLVVGTGQSGAQIAEDLHLAGRRVHLAVGSAPRVARVHRGRDVVAWLEDMGHYDRPVTEQPVQERGRDRTNHYVTGRDGGRDIDLRVFAQEGMVLHGHLVDIGTDSIRFADDLARNLDAADAVYTGINAAIDDWIAAQGLAAPPGQVYAPAWRPPDVGGRDVVPCGDVAAVVWATGFTNDYGWLHAAAFDGGGRPVHLRGVSSVPNLYFVGLPWLHTWGSGRFAGVAVDADHIADHIAGQIQSPAALPSGLPRELSAAS